MPKFTVLSRKDAFVDYTTEVEAADAEAAVALVDQGSGFTWEERGVVEFDARLLVALDEDGQEIEGTERGDFN